MLSNYVRIALRILVKHAGYTFINMFGLAVGLAVCLLVGIYVRHELSFDRYLSNSDRVVRLITDNARETSTSAPRGIAHQLEERFPEINAVTEVHRFPADVLFRVEESRTADYVLKNVFSVDSSFLAVFPYRLLAGDASSALSRPGQVVLTQSLAQRLFGSLDVLGRTIKMETSRELTVTGVIEDPPTATHFQFSALVSLYGRTLDARYSGDIEWDTGSGYVYMELHPDAQVAALTSMISSYAEMSASAGDPGFMLQPVTRIHLHTKAGTDIAPRGDIRYLYLFSGLGLLVLLTACANYINLATARAATRAREIGIRKIVGATRSQLRYQLLGESVLMALLALPVAILIAGSVLPTVNSMAGLELRLGSMLDVGGIATLSALTLMIGLLAGLYPAAFMSRTVPGSSLLSTVVQGGGKGFRQTLVVTQFVTTLVLVMTTMVMGLQRRYIQNTNLGFDREHVITTPVFALGDEGYYSFKETLLATTDIMAVSSGPILGLNHNSTEVSFEDPATGDEKKIIALDVDHDYDKVFGLSMESGRFFSQSVTSDTSEAVVINPTAARLFSSGENKVPDVLRFEGVNSRVIGVVNEFHHASMHMPLQPVVMRLKPGNNWMAMVRLAPGNVADRLATIREAWNRFQPERPFTYNFLEDRIAAQYVSETRLASLFGLLSMTAIALACMGLFGLAAFMAARRTREIGIRKVLGATVCSIISLLSTDYLRLVGIAFVLAIPIAYIMSRKWLEEFSFQIEIPWWGFLLVGTGMMLLTIVSVGYQAARVAMLDPVETLKSE